MDVHFASGKSEVLKGDAAALDSTAAWLTQNPHWLVLIEGYTDGRGTKEQNLAVSERRARFVMSYLVTKGVEPDRISIASYGADRPLCTEKNERCRAKNRRVHFLVRER
jgi:peptidoglycan-associated lipoprotein